MSRQGPRRARRARKTPARWLRLLALAALAALAVLRASPAGAQGPGPTDSAHALSELARLFPREADLFVERDGLSYLSLPLDVLKESRPDLSDVRIFNNDGGEVPFLVNTSLPRRPPGSLERIEATPIEVRQVRKKGEDGAAKKRERIVVEVPETSTWTGAWDLVLSTSIPRFVRRVEVREAGEKGRSITKASVFRLVSPLRERTKVPLPPGIKGRIEIALESEDDDTTYLEPTLVFEAAVLRSATAPAVVPLAEIARSRGEGRTILTLARPRGLVPNALRIETSTGTFYRPIEVSDDGVGRTGGRLVSAPVYRVEAMPSVTEIEIPLVGAKGDRLHVEVVDGDSPELSDLRVLAVVERPSLIFSLSPGAARTAAGTLRFGGGRAHRPSYDLEGFGQAMNRIDSERLADHLQDPREVPEARVGEIRASPIFDPSPALAFAMRPAAEIDLGGYTHRLSVRATDAPEGVSRARLAPEVLAVARPDLGDLRIVDAQSRQWPYLLEEGAATQLVPLVVAAPQRKEGRSRFALGLPASPLFIAELALDIPASYLERDYRLTGKAEGGHEQTLTEGHFARRPGEPRSITLALPKVRLSSLELIVEDGDDAPLDVRGAQASISVPDLYLVAPAGSYTLLAGLPGASVPRYELAGARDLVLSVSAPAATLGALEANPKHVPAPVPGAVESYALWAALGLAVVMLGALTLRLAHSEGRAGEPEKQTGSEPKRASKAASKKRATKSESEPGTASESTSETGTEAASEPAIEAAIAPVTESATESAAVTEPVTESATATESATVTEPVSKPATEAAAAPDAAIASNSDSAPASDRNPAK